MSVNQEQVPAPLDSTESTQPIVIPEPTKIKYKQMMWKTYRHTGSEEHYAIYKEALNQATAEIKIYKRSYEQKIAFNIKYDSKSFYAYVRNKQKVQDKVGL